MLKKRLCAASFMVVLLTLALWADFYYLKDGLLLHALFLTGTFLSFREFWPLCRATGHQTFSVWGTFSGCALVVVHYCSMRLALDPGGNAFKHGMDLSTGALAVAILGTFILTAKRHKFEASLGGVAVTSLGLLYIFFLPSFVLKLRYMGTDGVLGGNDWNAFGNKMVIATIVLAKGCDVWAYIIGRQWGRHKLVPALSPGKTVEGLAGGLAGSVALSLFLRWEPIGVFSGFSLPTTCLLGLCIGLAAVMGDLTESLLKRSAGTKDAGQIVPGYGGALDVVDSLMVAGPVAYFLISAIMYCR